LAENGAFEVRLLGKNAFVTGGSRGIGRAICLGLARQGANISFTYREADAKAAAVAEEIKLLGVQAKAFKADVRDRSEIRRIFRLLKGSGASIDVLVNNAGINNPTDFDLLSDEDWDEVLSVNLKGPFIVTQEAMDLLKTSSNASIINIGSVSGQYGGPRTAHYAASKAGLISLGQVVARFGAEFGIRCNTLALGLIGSEMATEGLKSQAVNKAAESILLRRLGTLNEVSESVIYLASDESSYVTGQTINVNGGLYF
jgi:3-oxoacyl-[acyl-carrier protein] reductase